MSTVIDLFGVTESEKIRTLGFYQPFGSLMLHGKVETRWVKKYKKPPFPLGKYLFYTTKNPVNGLTLMDWCGSEMIDTINKTLQDEGKGEETASLNGYAIATGDLFKVCPLKETDLSFIKFIGEKEFFDKDGFGTKKVQWALHFKNIQRIKVFKFEDGKQGVGFLPDKYKIKV